MNTYRRLLRLPGAAAMFCAGLVGRLQMGVVSLGLTLLVVGSTGSYAMAGAVTAAQTLAMAFVSPYGSRLADRIGQSSALPRLVAVHVGAMVGLTWSVLAGGPPALWLILAVVAGSSVPMIGSMTRARWAMIARAPADRSSAFAMESVADEVSFVVGPVIASALAMTFFPAAAVLFGMLTLAVGGLWLSRLHSTAPPAAPKRPESEAAVLRFPGMAAMFLMMIALGGVFGSVQLATVAFAEAAAPAATGLLLGAFSLGSLISGVYLGSRTRSWSLTSQVRIGVVTLSLALLPMAFVGSVPAFALVAFAAGLSVSVVMIGSFALVERLVPAARLTEGLSRAAAGIALGIAAASWLCGAVIDVAGPAPALLLSVVFAALAAAIFWTRASRMSQLEQRADRSDLADAPTVTEVQPDRPANSGVLR